MFTFQIKDDYQNGIMKLLKEVINNDAKYIND